MHKKDPAKNENGYSLLTKTGAVNYKRFINTMDYSLDQIKLREIYEKVYRRLDFSFHYRRKEYTDSVINVTFLYNVCEYNKITKNRYIKFGYDEKDVIFHDSVCVIDGELIAIELNQSVQEPLSKELLGKYFVLCDGVYKLSKNPKSIKLTSVLRDELYHNGFICNGKRYVRWKRSSGSSRVGKCLFIDENLYDRMHKWEKCGIKVNEGDQIDLAAFESYISLPSSSIIDTMEINPENILIIDDFESTFKDDVVSVHDSDGKMIAERKECDITNSIWDGQGLIDISLMGEYADKGMILLRNLFFKCCCFNSNLQQWFADNNITDVSQLNGFTLAKSLSDIKLITTPSSIKYCKFGTVKQWLKHVDSTYGIVKYDKKTHFFGGRLVQSHYQLLNTIQLSKEDTRRLLEPTFNYITLLKTDPDVMRFHIKYPIEEADIISPAASKNDIVYKMLGINNKFAQTKLYYDFKTDLLKAFVKNLKLGHVLINGNYSTLCGNPIEMLLAAIGKFDGESRLGVGNIHTVRFEYGKRLLGSRSPHICVSNVWLPINRADEEIDKYLNLTPEIVCINSIGENVLQKLSGSDFDSDTVMLTDNQILINNALKNDGIFPVPVNNVSSAKTKRYYSAREKADLDIKTSNNLIGDIVNLSQELNTLIWHQLNNGASVADVEDIYLDVCKLNIMSGTEIDKAKKEFLVNNGKELHDLRTKYCTKKDGKTIKPNFFNIKDRKKGYYDTDKKVYQRHDTTMDYLQYHINSFQLSRKGRTNNLEFIPFVDIVDTDKYDCHKVTKSQVERVIDIVRKYRSTINEIYNSDLLTEVLKATIACEERQNVIEYIGNIDFSYNTTVYLLKTIEQPEYADIRRTVFNTLFGYPNSSFFDAISVAKEELPTIEPADDGNIEIYGEKYAKIYKKQPIFID